MRTVGGYTLTSEIGRGGNASVWRATTPDGRAVAVKIIDLPDAGRRARFAREKRLLAQLGELEGFVPLLDAGETPEGAFLVMPLYTKGTLRPQLASFDVDRARALGVTLARAIGRAHALGVVHRDLKPENVLITDDGQPLIADLGLAKHFDPEISGASQSQALSKQGELRGTPGFMAPEQMRDAASVGPESDVFALGAILYEALTRRPAFAGGSMLELLERAHEGRFVPIRVLRAEVPVALARVVERALSPAVEKRFAHGEELARALEGTAPRRRTALVAAGAVVFLLLAVFLLVPPRFKERYVSHEEPYLHPRPPRAPEPPAPPDSARHWVERAAEAERAGEREKALAHFTKALEVDASFHLAWYGRGLTRDRAGDRAGAASDFERTVSVNPKFAPGWLRLGYAKEALGDLAAALSAYTRATEEDPSYAIAFTCRGVTRTARKEYEGAAADFERALALDPRQAATFIGRGLLRLNEGDVAGALADAGAAISLAPTAATAWRLLGATQHQTCDERAALDSLTRALALDPTLATAWKERGAVHTARGEPHEAIADYERALALHPRDPTSWHELGFLKDRAGDLEGAIAAFTKALDQDPEMVTALLNRGFARSRANDVAGASADYERALVLDPKVEAAYRNLAILRVAEGRLDEADPLFTRAIALDDRSWISWAGRGSVRAKKDPAAALADYDRALELNPGYVAALVNRGVLRSNQNDLDGAFADYSAAIALEPKMGVTWLNRAGVREKMAKAKAAAEGRPDRAGLEAALVDYERGLELDPRSAKADQIRKRVEAIRETLSVK